MKAYWIIGIMLAAGLQAQPHDCSVDVYLIIAASTPKEMLLDAEVTATTMFREIGVNVHMRMGRPARDPIHACGAPIVVKLEEAVGYHGSPNALAYATPDKESGACIHVFIDRVRLQSGRPLPAFSSALLAHVMVHEITHVFEKMARHSEEGVMKPVWSSQDYTRMKRHPLPFAPEDVDLIRTGLARRITHAATD
jgi:hypothetical protein